VIASVLLSDLPAHAASGHTGVRDGATLQVSQATTYQGATFRMQTTCPEPWRSTRLESDLFGSPALLPARMSRLAQWTVSIAPKQRPGQYWISLNCFQQLTGRVAAAAEMRVRVLGALLRAVSRHDRQSAKLRPEIAVGVRRLRPGRERGDRSTLDRHPLDEGKGGYDRGRHHRLF
jgi:hypothetical protein